MQKKTVYLAGKITGDPFYRSKFYISIHALRVEGDRQGRISRFQISISIHALRVEGDSKNGQSFHLFLRKREKKLPL
mgnify:CR=1 FL=1